jgi:hypothetical protein
MAEYRTVEGPFSTIDTFAELTTFEGETGVGPIQVPQGVSRIVEIWSSIAAEIAASEEHSYGLRLSGKGMVQGDQDFNLGSAAAQSGTAAAGIMRDGPHILPVDLAVKPGENITVRVVANGIALSATGQASITLVFA